MANLKKAIAWYIINVVLGFLPILIVVLLKISKLNDKVVVISADELNNLLKSFIISFFSCAIACAVSYDFVMTRERISRKSVRLMFSINIILLLPTLVYYTAGIFTTSPTADTPLQPLIIIQLITFTIASAYSIGIKTQCLE